MCSTRRNFIFQSGILAAGAGISNLIPFHAMAGRRYSANDTIRVALIGCNGQGWTDLTHMLANKGVQVATLCDIDQNVLSRRLADLNALGVRGVKTTGDYRKVLDDKGVDAVIIATPDHWHPLILTDALKAGKDVYCEKPLANSIYEADLMLHIAQHSGKVIQVGQWQRSVPHFKDAVDFVKSGKLGKIRLVKAWAYQGWMHSIPVKPDGLPPAGVDYKMWLGPAPLRTFNPNRFHFNFRWYWDYAGGLMTDWGVHLIDYVLAGMEPGSPISIMASGGKLAYPADAQETPDTLQTVYEFEGFNCLWEHAMGISGGNYGRDHGIAYIGNNGTLILDRSGWEVIPETENKVPKMQAVPMSSSGRDGLGLHTKNFIDVMRSRKFADLTAPIEVGYKAAVTCHMGNLAYKTKEKLHYDASSKRFKEDSANQLYTREYHNGWELPKV